MQGYQPARKGSGQDSDWCVPGWGTSHCWDAGPTIYPTMEIPSALLSLGSQGKRQVGRTAVSVAAIRSRSLAYSDHLCCLLPAVSHLLPLAPAIALISSNYTCSHKPEIRSWSGWKVTWQKERKEEEKKTNFCFLNTHSWHDYRFEKGSEWPSADWFNVPVRALYSCSSLESLRCPQPVPSCCLPSPMHTLCTPTCC